MTQEGDAKGSGPHQYVVLTPEALQQRSSDDDISLLDLWAVLARKRILVLGISAVVIAVSVVLSFLIPPVYQASIYFRAPYTSDIEALNIPDFSADYTVEDIFTEFQNNFMARNNLWKFFTDKQLFRTYTDNDKFDESHLRDVFEKFFLKDIAMHKDQAEDEITRFAHATLNWEDSVDSAALLNEYSEMILQLTAQQYSNELEKKLALGKERTQQKIDLLRASDKRLTKNRLAELEENIQIAKELGFKRSKGLEEQMSSEVSVNVLEEQPLYYQGYEVLEAEKSALLARENHDPFIRDLNKLVSRLEYLNSIKISDANLQVARIIQKAQAADSPIKPDKMMIVAIGVMLGLMSGIIGALISNIIDRWKEQGDQATV